MKKEKVRKIILGAFISVGIIITVITIIQLPLFKNTTKTTTGVITEVGCGYRYLRFGYKYVFIAGNEESPQFYGRTQKVCTTTGYEIGDYVEVLYNPSNPEISYINSFPLIWGATIAGAILAIFFTGIGIIGMVRPEWIKWR